MTRPSENSTGESDDRSTGGWPAFERRPLLKALGAGATLSLGGGTATATGEETDTPEDGDDGTGVIDPVFGYPTTDAGNVPDGIEPAHEVEMLIVPPTGPGNPAFYYFEPSGLRVNTGDVVQFTSLSPDHTITAYHQGIGLPQRVPEEAPPFSSPVLGPGAAWLYRFEHEGVYDVYCGPHHLYGMVMRLVVGDVAEGELPQYATSVETVPSREEFEQALNETSEQNEDCEWPFVMPAEVLDTDALDPTNLLDAGEVSFETVAEELGYEFEPEESPEAMGATVQTSEHDEHGEILVGPDGMTLYMFDQDTQDAGESSCYEDCADAWPPLTAEGEPTAGDGVTAELTTFERETGERQVAANGWPLYYFAQDEAPGDAAGQGANDVWWVLGPDGTPIKSDSDE